MKIAGLEICSFPLAHHGLNLLGGNLTLLEGCPPGQLEILQQVFDLIILSGAKVQILNNENGIISLKLISNNIDKTLAMWQVQNLRGKVRLISTTTINFRLSPRQVNCFLDLISNSE